MKKRTIEKLINVLHKNGFYSNAKEPDTACSEDILIGCIDNMAWSITHSGDLNYNLIIKNTFLIANPKGYKVEVNEWKEHKGRDVIKTYTIDYKTHDSFIRLLSCTGNPIISSEKLTGNVLVLVYKVDNLFSEKQFVITEGKAVDITYGLNGE